MSPRAVDSSLKEMVQGRISSFKPIEPNSLKLFDLLKDPESRPGDITAIVATNPVFAAKVLQSVNSAFFNVPEKVTSVGRAITLLGYNNVRSLVLADALQNIIPGEKEAAPGNHVKMWIHSAIVSACAGYLGKRIFRLSEYQLSTIGLLHDIGKYFIHTLEHRGNPSEKLPLIAREEGSCGINHAVLGSIIVEGWQLSDLVSGTIAYHHHPTFLPPASIPAGYLVPSFIVSLSDLLGKLLNPDGQENEFLPIRDDYYELFKLRNDAAAFVTPDLIKEVEKARHTVEIYMEEA